MGAVAAGFAVLVLAVALRVFAGYPALPPGLRTLSRREYAFLRAAAEATFPPGGRPAPSGSEAGVARYLDGFAASQPARMRTLIRLLVFLLEHATLLFPPGSRGLRRFTRLPAAAQARYLAGWERSRLGPRRLVFQSLRALLTLGYLADPPVLRALGLAPKRIEPRPCEADLLWARIGEPRSAIRWQPEDLARPVPRTPLDPDGALDPRYAERDA